MGSYTRTSPVAGAAVTAAYIEAELLKIQTAINSLAIGQVADGLITNAKLAADEAYLPLVLSHDDIPISQTDVLFDQISVPVACTLAAVKIIADTLTATVQVDVKKNGTTVLSGLVTVAAADTTYSGGVSVTSFASGDKLQLHLTTNGSGVCTRLRVTCLFKTAHI